MNIFIAGGSGTVGVPLVRALVAAGHRVTALTRSPDKRDMLLGLGARVAIADALRPEALAPAVAAAEPTHVIHQLTALPADGPRRAADLEATNRLRIEGTANLIAASVRAGARRLVIGSFGGLPTDGAGDTEASFRSFTSTTPWPRRCSRSIAGCAGAPTTSWTIGRPA